MRGHSHSSRDLAKCNNKKYRSGPVFFFGRVAACNIFTHDSSRVHQKVMLLGTIMKNYIYIVAGIVCNNACTRRALMFAVSQLQPDQMAFLFLNCLRERLDSLSMEDKAMTA